MKMNLRVIALALSGIYATSFSSQAAAAEDEGWSWFVAPYVWAASISTNHKRDVPPSDASSGTNFKNILDKLDGAFMIHAEGQGEHIGMFTDYLYLGLGDNHNFDHLRTRSQLDATLFELAMVWSPGDQRYTGFELFGGLRYVDIGLSIKFEPNDPAFPTLRVDPDKSYSDFMLGARYKWDLSDRWGLTVRTDGSWGETDGTYNLSAMFNYNMKNGEWLFGYRYLSIDVATDISNTDLTIHGPQIGYGFNF